MAPIQKIVALIRPGQGDLATIQEACPASSNMVRGRPILQCGFGWALVSGPWRENWGRKNKEIVETVATRATLLTRSRYDQPFIESILAKRGILESPTTGATLLTTAR